MAKKEVLEYVSQNNLLSAIGKSNAGVYAITIDGHAAYIGESYDIYGRCIKHLKHIISCTGRRKYIILNYAISHMHRVDCVMIETLEGLTERLKEERKVTQRYRYLLNMHNYRFYNEIKLMEEPNIVEAIISCDDNLIQ